MKTFHLSNSNLQLPASSRAWQWSSVSEWTFGKAEEKILLVCVCFNTCFNSWDLYCLGFEVHYVKMLWPLLGTSIYHLDWALLFSVFACLCSQRKRRGRHRFLGWPKDGLAGWSWVSSDLGSLSNIWCQMLGNLQNIFPSCSRASASWRLTDFLSSRGDSDILICWGFFPICVVVVVFSIYFVKILGFKVWVFRILAKF